MLVGLLGVIPSAAMSQPTTRCDDAHRVRSVRFSGSPLFDNVSLAASIVTPSPTFTNRAASALHLGTLPCSDSLELQLDALRIAVLHRQAGWLQAAVAARRSAAPNGLTILFDITPGVPALLDTMMITGLPVLPAGQGSYDGPLRALQGIRFDRIRLDTTITSVVARLRDVGYARAGRPTLAIEIDSTRAHVRVTLGFTPGPLMTVRAITVDVAGFGSHGASIDTADVRGLTTLRAGVPYRASKVLEAQRDLYRSDAFRLVIIDTATPPGATSGGATSSAGAADSLIDLRISVAEARTRNARVGLGWATLECIRSQARLVDRRFLGVGRRLELTARASRLGVGAPADFAPGLCSSALRADTQFTVLNHYIGATVSSTRLFGSPLSPVTTIYTERRSEPYAYVRTIDIGALVEVSRQVTRFMSATAGMQYENGRTKIDPAEACSRFGQCSKQDYDQSAFGRSVGTLSTAITRERVNNTLDPSGGHRLRGEVRAGQAYSLVDSSQVRFYRASADASTYVRFLGGVLAGRIQASRAFAPGAKLVDGSPLIPQQERLFAGGQSTVRGYQQNLLGPLVYVVSDIDTVTNGGVPVIQTKPGAGYGRAVPRGGTAMTVANLEYRRPFRWLAEQLQFAAFVDVGNVWEGGSAAFKVSNLRATPGLGLRVVTGLGPFRVDVGYQPYDPRAGRALFISKGVGGTGGTILCASPGNKVSIDPQNPGSIFDCPETYRPPSARGVLSRLVFHFGLGQAF
jgi:outer membrane protein insertion porin family/translocation and assembly module TamA